MPHSCGTSRKRRSTVLLFGYFVDVDSFRGILLLYSIGKSVNKAVSLDEIQSIQDEYTSRKIGFNQKNHAHGK